MSVLEKIRSRTGLLVGIVGLALVIFILESLLGSGASLFTSNDRTIGMIAGDKIDVLEFQKRVDEQIANIMATNPQATIDDNTRQQINESVWNQLISDKVIKVQYKKLGVAVSDDELADLMLVHPHSYVQQQLTDQKTGKIYEGFAKPDGSLDVARLNQWVNQMSPEQEKFWKSLEDAVLEVRTAEKYNNLIKKGIYVTTAEAKDAFIAQTKQMNVDFVMKRYNTVSDSAVKVSDEDIQNYYNKHQNDYKVDEATRKVEYISFDVMPSKQDFEDLMKDAQRVADDFKTKSGREDTAFVMQENENNQLNIADYTKKNMPIADSSVFTAPAGTVYGPYTEGTFLKVYKLEKTSQVADSGKVRHLLLAYAGSGASQDIKRTKEQAKKLADSLVVLLKAGASFDQLVDTYSDDGGKRKPDLRNPQVQMQMARFFPDPKDTNVWKGKGGNYGWIKADSRDWVPEFTKGATQHKKGDLFVVESQYGYHIMEVLDESKSHFTQYTIAQVDKLIGPSSATAQEYYKLASDFAGKNTTAEAFNKSVDAEKLNKRIADNIRESDKNLPGLENAKELVKWAYAAKKGDVSGVFEFKDRYIVANLVTVRERGIAPLEDVKEDATAKAIRDKKAEQFVTEFKNKGGSTVADIAAKMGLTAEKMENLTFASYNVAGIGRENALIGTAYALKAGATSQPTIGENGVFVVNVASVNETPLPKDFKNKQKELEQYNASRVDGDVYGVLKEKANIEDHRGKFDFN